MKRFLICLLPLTASCASSPNEDTAREDLIMVGSEDGRTITLPVRTETVAQRTTIDAPRDDIWALLPAVYEEVGLPAPAADRSTWTVAVQNHSIMRRVGSERMSRLIDCGRNMDGDNADTHRIRLSVRTWLEPGTNGTGVNSRVEATAQSVEGRAGSMTCTSRGELELLIANALNARLSGDWRNPRGTRTPSGY